MNEFLQRTTAATTINNGDDDDDDVCVVNLISIHLCMYVHSLIDVVFCDNVYEIERARTVAATVASAVTTKTTILIIIAEIRMKEHAATAYEQKEFAKETNACKNA